MNGVSERLIGTLVSRARTCLQSVGLPPRFFPEALKDTVLKCNFSPTSTPLYNHTEKPDSINEDSNVKLSRYRIPIFALTDRPVNSDHLRAFGSPVWFHLHGSREPPTKLAIRGKRGILIG